MMRKIASAFKMAAGNIRSHFFHTLLSILGMVIGVAALVGILCLIDGMEQYAKDQITNTTSLKSILITSRSTKNVKGIVVKRDTFSYITYARFTALEKVITQPATMFIHSSQSLEASLKGGDTKVVSLLFGFGGHLSDEVNLIKGRFFTPADFQSDRAFALVNRAFVKEIVRNDSLASLVGKEILLRERIAEIVGIIDNKSSNPEILIPITLLSSAELKEHPPAVAIEAGDIDDVNEIRDAAKSWIKREFKDSFSDFELITNEFRLEQATQGFALFRVIMGMIVGISVLVGGIGVMNVLLISVTQRTMEIGVRKAMGAKRKDIIMQFLAESITISCFGSFCGLVLGILGTMGAIPIIKALTKVPFQASYTWNTIGVVGVVAILVGIVFGTYPAMRASRLDPVEAIRRE